MIDFEVEIFDRAARAALAVAPGAYVSSQHVSAPPQFPAASIVETSNTELAGTADSSGEERYAAVTYEVNVYSASRDDPKAECRGIVSAIDGALRGLNLSRTFMGPVDNAADPSIYRIVARYTGAVGKDGLTYGR